MRSREPKASVAVADLERLLDLSALLTSTLDLPSVLTKVLQNAEALMQAEASSVMLHDGAARELYYEVALGEAGGRIKEQKRLKVGVGIAGWVAEHRTPLRIEDAYQDPRFFRDFDKKTGFHTKSILCLPLLAQDKLIGVAQIINKKGAPRFTAEDQALFTRFCHIAAVAIDNALLHEKLLAQDRLQRDLQLAEEIQRASLPSDIPFVAGLRVEYRSQACRHVAGDVLDISRLDDGRLAVLVGDVSGKGVPAALFAAKFSGDFAFHCHGGTAGGELFTRLNRLVAERSTRGMFITAVHAVFDPATGAVSLVNAGHVLPVIVGPKPGDLRLARTPEFPPLGVVDDLLYESAEVRLAPGERMVLMTDGVTDARSRDGGSLGDAAALKALSARPAIAVTRLMKTVNEFTAHAALADDITIASVGYGDYQERSVPSRTEQLGAMRAFVAERAAAHGFDERLQGRISLAVDEALANIIKHTYAMDPGGRIRVGVGWGGGELAIHIRDWGPKQDPGRFASRDLAELRPGGLGLHYMREVMDLVEFDATLLDGNELHLLVAKPGGERQCK